ncbi:MAG TPA: 50S ribosomal protein L9 [Terriglobia bacterium]|nr:50S ribosomal protein L9 [Terriglobia bacterium]
MAKTLELILREDVEHLGRRGDVVRVKGGYARNFLLPRKLAMAVTEGNRKVVEQEKAAALKRDAREKADAQQLAGMLEKITLSFARKAGESGVLFGSVTTIDIAEELHRKGYEIDRRKIQLEEPLKQLGEFQVPVKLHKDVTVSVPVQVVAEAS